jgi:tetratricopeptide (TPR) repeat protein
MEPATPEDALFLQTALRIGVIGVRQSEKIVELCAQTAKSAQEVAELYQFMTAGQVDRVVRSLGREPSPAHRRPVAAADHGPLRSSGIGGWLVLAGVIALGFVAWKYFSKPSNAPRRVGVPPSTSVPSGSTSKSQIEKRETEAREAYARAESHLAAGKFDEALAAFQSFERGYTDTETYAGVAEAVWRSMDRCRAELGRTEPVTTDAQRRHLEQWSRVKALATEGRWPEAEPLLRELAADLSADDVRRPQIERWLSRVTVDPGLVRTWERVKETAAAGDWRRAYEEIRAFSAANSGAGNFEKIAPEVHTLMEKAYSEKLALDQMDAARDATSRQEWRAVLAAADELERSRAGTDTYRKFKAEIETLKADAHRKLGAPATEAAAKAFDQAKAAEAAGRFGDAQAAYERILSEFASSEWVSAHRAELEASLARVRQRRAEGREAEAARSFAEVGRLMRSKAWREAEKELERIQTEYLGTTFLAQKRADVDKAANECRREIDAIRARILDDLEWGADRWQAFAPTVHIALSSREAAEGKQSIELEFPAHSRGDRRKWPRATCVLNRAPPAKSVRLTFQARSSGGSASLLVDFAQRVGLEEVIFTAPPVAVGSTWTRVTIPLSSFKKDWFAVQRPDETPAKIDFNLSMLQFLGITSNSPDRSIKVWIDDIRFETSE